MKWDFCLVKTKTTMNLNGNNVEKIDLPPPNLKILGKPCKIAGWGLTEQNFEAKYLRKTVSIQRRKDRNKRFCIKAREYKAFCSRGNFPQRKLSKARFTISVRIKNINLLTKIEKLLVPIAPLVLRLPL